MLKKAPSVKAVFKQITPMSIVGYLFLWRVDFLAGRRLAS